jgi:MFS family permease
VPPAERTRFFAAALSAFMAFATQGLFTGLAAVFLNITLHHPSHALAGAVLGAMYASAVAAQILTSAWSVTREFEAGMTAMVAGLGLAVLAVWLRPPSLALFIAAGAVIGAGAGVIFRGAIGTVMSIAPPDRIAESLAGMFVATFVGISLPVVGAGITLSRHVSPQDTILGFAIVVSAGIAASAVKLVGRTTTRAGREPTPAAPGANSRDGKPGHQRIDHPKERRAV